MKIPTKYFSTRHQSLMLDVADPIHRACDFFVSSSSNENIDIAEVNDWLHGSNVCAPWPEFLVAFASNGCGDYFAYDLRESPPSIIYVDQDATPEERLNDFEALRYGSFDDWYEAQIQTHICQCCQSRNTDLKASDDRRFLMRVCRDCGLEERTEAIDL